MNQRIKIINTSNFILKVMSNLSELQTLFDKGMLKEAIAQVKELEDDISPDNPEFFNFKLLNAKILLEMGKYEEGEKLLNTMLDFGRRGGLMVRIDMIILLSDILWRKGNWDQAFFMIEMGEYDFTKLGKLAQGQEKDLRYAELKRLKGIYYRYSGELDLAVEYFNECLVTAEQMGDKRLLAKIYNLLGLVSRETGELSASWNYYLKSYELYKDFNDEIGMGVTQLNFASLQEYLGDIGSATKNYEEALQIAEKVANLRLQANTLSAIGILKLKTGEFKDGIRMVNAGLTLKSNLGNDLDSALTFYKFITYLISTDQEALIPIYFDEMERIYIRNQQNNLIKLYYDLIQAGIYQTNLNKSPDEAKAILERIIQQNVVDLQLTIHAMVSTANILLDELIASPSQEIFKDINMLLSQLKDILEFDYNLSLDIEVSILKSKLLIFEGEFRSALIQINACLALIESEDLKYLEREALETYNLILEQFKMQTGNTGENLSSQITNGKTTNDGGKVFFITDSNHNILFKENLSQEDTSSIDEKDFFQPSPPENSLFSDPTISRIPIGDYYLIHKWFTDLSFYYIYKGDSSIKEVQRLNKLISNLSNIYDFTETEKIKAIESKLVTELLL